MTKKFPLQSLVDLSHLRLDQMTKLLGQLMSSEQKAEDRLQLLLQYREECQATFLAAARGGLGKEAWNNYRSFVDRLELAIKAAQDAAAWSRQQTSSGQQEWLEKHGNARVFDTLADGHRHRELAQERRREQKSADEHSAVRLQHQSGWTNS